MKITLNNGKTITFDDDGESEFWFFGFLDDFTETLNHVDHITHDGRTVKAIVLEPGDLEIASKIFMKYMEVM